MRIGLLLNILDEEYQISVYEGIKHKAEELGFEIICFQLENLTFVNESTFRNFINQSFFNLDGIILLSSVLLDRVDFFVKNDLKSIWPNIPIVSIGEKLEGIPSIMVQTDASMKELLSHLIEVHSYRKFCYISGTYNHHDAKRREETFISTITQYSKVFPEIEYKMQHGIFTEISAINAMEEFIQTEPDFSPDVIVCANDNMAIGVYKFLKTHPENKNLQNCAVTGFDDIPQSRFEMPAITTIKQPLNELGTRAMETIYDMINGRKVPDEKYVESQLILRNSCGCNKTFDEISQPKFLSQIQTNYIRSESLLKLVSHIGQDLNFATSKDDLRRFIDEEMAQLDIKNFSILWFSKKTSDLDELITQGLYVEPVYVRRNGNYFYEFAGHRNLSIGDFYRKYISYDEVHPLSLVFRFLSVGSEIKGCIFYDADNHLLPYLCSIGIDIGYTLNRIDDLEEKKKRSEYLENEITKRTRELVAESKKRMEVEAEVLKVSEIERQRFSLDLHDDICQRLAGISMLCRSYSNQEDSVSKTQMVELAQLISETLQATRQYAHNSYPVEIESLGMNHSLNNLCNSFEKQFGINCKYEWDVSENFEFSSLQKLNVFRIIQEALHNVAKHSNAKNVEVSVLSLKNDKTVVVSVIDDGKGFSEESKALSGIGLNSMQYRANQINAEYSIKNAEPHGTCVELIIRNQVD